VTFKFNFNLNVDGKFPSRNSKRTDRYLTTLVLIANKHVKNKAISHNTLTYFDDRRPCEFSVICFPVFLYNQTKHAWQAHVPNVCPQEVMEFVRNLPRKNQRIFSNEPVLP